ncbi:MAG: LysM domain-containing protein [Pseudomonadota bacterium]|nr:LysM domain-containing protein [Pseudomonadota bacterium]
MTTRRHLLLLLTALLSGSPALAEELTLAADHPQEYVVEKGDTLWDISGRFLEEPWRWPELWRVNPGIANPHLIYPGDRLYLVDTLDGPALMIERGDATVKLSPRVRETALRQAVPTIPLEAISQFLSRSLVLPDPHVPGAGYVVQGADEHVITGAGDRIYVRNLPEATENFFEIYRVGGPYRDPDGHEILGYEGLHVGSAVVEKAGDPATLLITQSSREVLPGDILMPRPDELVEPTFTPHAVDASFTGRVISVVDGVSQIGTNNIVVLNRGIADGMETGHVLAVHQTPDPARDPQHAGLVELPTLEAGKLMVFRVYDRVSFALVMSATRAIHLGDRITAP